MMALGWLVEFALESAGAILYFRRNKILSILLAFCAVTDFAAALARPMFSATFIYGQCAWLQLAGKGLLLIWLGCSICGKFAAECDRLKVVFATAFMSASSISIVMSVFFASEKLKDRLLDAEIVTNLIIFGMIFLGWLGRRAFLSKEWKWITAGFMVMVGGDLAVTLLWFVWDGARHWYALGNILALSIWIAGPIASMKLSEVRRSIGQRIITAEKVSVC